MWRRSLWNCKTSLFCSYTLISHDIRCSRAFTEKIYVFHFRKMSMQFFVLMYKHTAHSFTHLVIHIYTNNEKWFTTSCIYSVDLIWMWHIITIGVHFICNVSTTYSTSIWLFWMSEVSKWRKNLEMSRISKREVYLKQTNETMWLVVQ